MSFPWKSHPGHELLHLGHIYGLFSKSTYICTRIRWKCNIHCDASLCRRKTPWIIELDRKYAIAVCVRWANYVLHRHVDDTQWSFLSCLSQSNITKRTLDVRHGSTSITLKLESYPAQVRLSFAMATIPSSITLFAICLSTEILAHTTSAFHHGQIPFQYQNTFQLELLSAWVYHPGIAQNKAYYLVISQEDQTLG